MQPGCRGICIATRRRLAGSNAAGKVGASWGAYAPAGLVLVLPRRDEEGALGNGRGCLDRVDDSTLMVTEGRQGLHALRWTHSWGVA
jgi:hypothetical protein